MRRLLPEDEWSRNVGSPSYPVSFLHEYAVGLIWDLLHTKQGPIELPTTDGGRSDDVLANIDQIIIPDALQSIAGYIPDISLLKDARPVRCIEVIVTSPVRPEKVSAIQNLGVEVVQVPARNEDELRAICSATETDKPTWWPKYSGHEEVFQSARRKTGVNWEGTRQYKILESQAKANQAINSLMDQLSRCSPEVRRAFVARLTDMSGLSSLYPIRRDNPKYIALYPVNVDQDVDANS